MLNPLRDALTETGLSAFQHDSSFKPVADASLSRFQTLRDSLERQMRRGDVTLKAAREKARAAAAELKNQLSAQAKGYSPVPRAFQDRLIEATDARRREKDNASLEQLQRETNRLLRQSLVEQQLQTRGAEFTGKTHTRALPGGHLAPSLGALLSFHETARAAGDEAAAEWGRRELESYRSRVTEPAELRQIDRACDRPEVVSPRIVATYLQALDAADFETMEQFVQHAIDTRDASACVAAFLLAREATGSTGARWVRNVLNGLHAFPDCALTLLRGAEAEARSLDAEAAKTHADYAVAVAEAQLSFAGVEPPTEGEIDRMDRLRATPLARVGEPIGLDLKRRGQLADEPAAPLGLGLADNVG